MTKTHNQLKDTIWSSTKSECIVFRGDLNSITGTALAAWPENIGYFSVEKMNDNG